MKGIVFIHIILLVPATIITSQKLKAQQNYSRPNEVLIERIKSTRGFIALWKFDELPGIPREATGKGRFPLR